MELSGFIYGTKKSSMGQKSCMTCPIHNCKFDNHRKCPIIKYNGTNKFDQNILGLKMGQMFWLSNIMGQKYFGQTI